MRSLNVIQSQNKEWGYFGTIQSNYNVSKLKAEKIYALTAELLAKDLGVKPSDLVNVLDSIEGRHLADGLMNYKVSKRASLQSIKRALTWLIRDNPTYVSILHPDTKDCERLQIENEWASPRF